MNGSGAMQRGWLNRGGTWYYLTGSGAMVEGWAYIGGSWYYMVPGNGAWCRLCQLFPLENLYLRY